MIYLFGSPKAPLIAKDNMVFDDSLCAFLNILKAIETYKEYTKTSCGFFESNLTWIPDVGYEIFDITSISVGTNITINNLWYTNESRDNKIGKIKIPYNSDVFKENMSNEKYANKFIKNYFPSLLTSANNDYSGTFEFTDQTITAEELKTLIKEQLNK